MAAERPEVADPRLAGAASNVRNGSIADLAHPLLGDNSRNESEL